VLIIVYVFFLMFDFHSRICVSHNTSHISYIISYNVIRPLAYSTLADLVHFVRADLTIHQLFKVVYIFSRNIHDPTLPLGIQSMWYVCVCMCVCMCVWWCVCDVCVMCVWCVYWCDVWCVCVYVCVMMCVWDVCDVWCVLCDVWCDVWCMMYDVWSMMMNVWCVWCVCDVCVLYVWCVCVRRILQIGSKSSRSHLSIAR